MLVLNVAGSASSIFADFVAPPRELYGRKRQFKLKRDSDRMMVGVRLTSAKQCRIERPGAKCDLEFEGLVGRRTMALILIEARCSKLGE